MLKLLKSSVAVVVLAVLMLMSPAQAQSAAEMTVRMSQLEDEVRQLMGQVEDLTFQVKQLKSQIAQGKTGSLEQGQGAAQPALRKKLATADTSGATADTSSDAISSQPLAPISSGQEQITDSALSEQAQSDGQPVQLRKAPGPQVLGAINGSAAKAGDGGFQGKVLVAPSQEDGPAVPDQTVEQGSLASIGSDAGGAAAGGGSDSIQQVSLAPESPEALYERSNESLLRRQFTDAEAGFRQFLDKYPDHDLAGSAQYWLGETYYAQADFRQAAQAFLKAYQQYPKSRRAADSLLKLGVSLGKLGQKQQACAAFDSVNSEYPKAVEARKRAQAESTRAGCTS